jgi:diketogulonate reductase-like aldo/keto reductase
MMAHWLSSVDSMVPVLDELKKQGKVRYIGITTVSRQQYSRLCGASIWMRARDDQDGRSVIVAE